MVIKNNKIYISDTNNNLIRLFSFHFQGSAKNELINMYDIIKNILEK